MILSVFQQRLSESVAVDFSPMSVGSKVRAFDCSLLAVSATLVGSTRCELCQHTVLLSPHWLSCHGCAVDVGHLTGLTDTTEFDSRTELIRLIPLHKGAFT